MANPKAAAQARAVLAKNRADVLRISSEKGMRATQGMLADSARDLEKRIREAVGRGLGDDTFTQAQLRATLEQVKQVQRELNKKLRTQILSDGQTAAEAAAVNTAEYLRTADEAFRGVGVQPLALNEARMLDAAVQGSQSSILTRLASSGTPASRVGRHGELVEPHPAKDGILTRYGMETIGVFEETLQRGLIARKSFTEMREDITAQSPFLQGAPKYWAERIVRTEIMGAFNRGAFEATREADEELGDVVKILSANFDDRTASDSYAVHGQIRRPTEAFETWTGLMQHPPARTERPRGDDHAPDLVGDPGGARTAQPGRGGGALGGRASAAEAQEQGRAQAEGDAADPGEVDGADRAVRQADEATAPEGARARGARARGASAGARGRLIAGALSGWYLSNTRDD